ncbi:PBECR4 domain-containing protein [Bifidobacterium samirii]|nr:PBECR4 domain-containing protein [Bifidobacterium samirii]
MNITKAKSLMLASARAAIPAYSRLVGMTTTFICEDGFALPVRWEASNFAHLCGLDYYTDGTRTRRYPYVKLYEHIAAGKRISERQLAPNGDPRWLPYKAEAITGAFHLDKAEVIVESGNSRILFYTGNTVWCIGVGYDREHDYYYPQSLVRKSYEKAMKPGSAIHRIDRIEYRPTTDG